MQLELKRIQQEVGITFIYVTHDQEEAMTMSNRLAVMRQGRIEQLGEPEDVYENPSTEFVAGFLGASNLLEGEVKESSNGDATRAAHRRHQRDVPPPSRSARRRLAGVGGRAAREDHDSNGEGDRPGGGTNSIDRERCAMSTYIGVSHQYKVDGPGGSDADRLRAEPGRRGGRLVPGSASTRPGSPSTRSRWCRRTNSRSRRKTNDGT